MAFFLSTTERAKRPASPTRGAQPLDSLAEFEVHAPTLRRRVVQAVGQPLFLVALVLSLLYAALAMYHLWALPVHMSLARLAAALAVILFLVAALLAGVPGVRRATQVLASFIGLLVAFYTLTQVHLLGQIQYSLSLLPLLIGLACFLVSRIWLSLQITITLAAWVATVWTSCTQPEWLHYGLTFLVTTLLAALVHVVRISGSTRLEKMRLRDTERKADLEAVRHALQKERQDRRAAEEALRESDLRLRLTSEAATDLVAQHAANGAYLYSSPRCTELLGVSPLELREHTLWDFAHPEDRLNVQETFLHVRAEGEPLTIEYRLRPSEGPERVVSTTMRPLFDSASSSVMHVASLTRDLTGERSRHASEVLHARCQQALLAQRKSAVFVLDRQGRVLSCEGTAREEFGLPAECIGRSVFEVFGQQEEWLLQLRRAIAGEQFETERSIEGIAFAVQFTSLIDIPGASQSTLAVARELTAERRGAYLETALRQKEDEAKRLAAALEEAEADLESEQRDRETLEANHHTTEEACRAATERARQFEAALREATSTVEQAQADRQSILAAVEEAEHAFVRSETLRRSLWELLPCTIFQLDEHGVYIEYRPAGEAPLHFVKGSSARESGQNPSAPIPEPMPNDTWLALVGQPLQEVGSPSWIKLLQDARTAAQSTGELSAFSYVAPSLKGEEQHYDVRLFAMKNGHCLGIIRNVTPQNTALTRLQGVQKECQRLQQSQEKAESEKSKLEASIAELRRQLQQVQTQSKEADRAAQALRHGIVEGITEIALIATDLRGRITAFGQGAIQLLGYPASQVVGEEVTHFFDELELVTRGQALSATRGKSLTPLEALTAVARREECEEREWSVVTEDERCLTVRVRVKLLRDTAQEPTGYLLTLTDSSEKERLSKIASDWKRGYETVVRHARDGILVVDESGVVLECNPAAEKLLGVSRTEFIASKFADRHLNQELTESVERGVRYYLATQDASMLPCRQEIELKQSNGGTLPVEFSVHAENRESGPVRFAMHLVDLQARRQWEAAYAEAERLLAVNAEIGSFLLGGLPWRDALQQCAQSLVRPFPGAFARIHIDLDAQENLEVQASAGASPELLLAQARWGPSLYARLKLGKSRLIAKEFQKEKWLEEIAGSSRTGIGSFLGYPLLFGEQFLGAIALFLPEGAVPADTDWLTSFAQQIALGAAHLSRRPTLPDASATEAVAVRAREMEVMLRSELEQLQLAKGQLETQVQGLLAEQNQRTDQVKALQVASDHLLLDEKLKAARKAVESAERARGEFLTAMSQEIRSPLTSLLGQTDILLDPHLESADRLKALQSVKRGSEHLLQVMNDLLDLSRIEHGQLRLDAVPCGPWQLVQEVLLSLNAVAQEKGVLLSATPSGPIPRQVSTDPTRLRQILHHLARQALLATPRGQVTLHLDTAHAYSGENTPQGSTEGDALAEHRLRICVEDEGEGLTSEEIEHLFDAVPQVGADHQRKYGGGGLGWCLARRLARRLGGDLQAESRSEGGNRFTLELPVSAAELDDAQTAEELTLTTTQFKPIQLPEQPLRLQGRALLVERNKDNQRVMAYFLERLGLCTEIAPNAETALEWLAEEDFDLFLIDVDSATPELDGPQLAHLLRDKGYKQPILAMLSQTLKGEEHAALEAGCDAVVFKPIEQEPWVATLSRFLPTAPADAEPISLRSQEPMEPPIPSTYREDADFMHLVREYAGSLTGRLAELRAALKVGDLVRFIKLGHMLKGSASTYGYPILSVMASELERAAYSGLDGPRLADMLSAMAAVIVRIQQAFMEESAMQMR